MEIVGGALAGDFCFGARPEKTGGAHALLFRERPERDAAVPTSVEICFWIAGGVMLLALRIVEFIGYDAVMLRVEAGDDREMIGECDGRIGWDHSVGRAGAVRGHGLKMRGAV